MEKSLRLLIIEDSADDTALILRELQRGGFAVTYERIETSEAMERAIEKEWDIIISDYHMPHFSGLTALALVQQNKLEIPFILVSGTIGENIAVAAIKAGANDYIMKDNLSRLVTSVKREIRENQKHRAAKLTAKKLQESETKYQNLVESIPCVTYIALLDAEGSTTYVSPQIQKILGFSPKEWLAQPDKWSKQIHPEDRQLVLKEYQDACIEAKQPFCCEYRMLTSDGREIWVHDEGTVIKDSESGEAKFIQGFFIDITKMKQFQLKLEKTNADLQQALNDLDKMQRKVALSERFHALGQMAAGIVHDFNNSLSSIMGLTELMLEFPDHPQHKNKTTEYLKLIYISAKDAAQIVWRLREFYRPKDTVDEYHLASLDEIIKKSVDVSQSKWQSQAQKQGATINISLQLNKTAVVLGSEFELREAIINLIFNAVDAIVGKAQQEKSPVETIAISTYQQEKSIILEISDTGMGMTPEVRQHCFEPFFSTKGEKGNGLGLSMVYGIMKRHGATCEIESSVGQGATFRFSFPQSEFQTQAPPMKKMESPTRSLRILLVDDKENVRNIVESYLKIDKHIVEFAADGEEGWEKFCTAPFDVVITDRAMPKISGDQLSALIKQKKPEIPIVMLTGFDDIIQGQKIPNVDFVLGKPTTLSQLRNILDKAIACPLNTKDKPQV